MTTMLTDPFVTETFRNSASGVRVENKAKNLTNHVVLLLDRSVSMRRHQAAVIAVVDAQIKHLARRSQELGQETRVSIYSFGSDVDCLVFDMDVLRLPSIATLYRVAGNTSLIDATVVALDDLGTTSALYGDHSYLLYVFTDGEENWSTLRPMALRERLDRLPENWTAAALVPHVLGQREAQQFGFPNGNIAIWSADADGGFEEAGRMVAAATDTFMTGRQQGRRGSRTVFSTGTDAVNDQTVTAALSTGALQPLQRGTYTLLDVTTREQTRPFVERRGHTYQNGRLYYQLTKTENIQPQKRIVVVNKRIGDAYADETSEIVGGQQVGSPNLRRMIGLPEMHVKVRPDFNPDFAIFVQSTAPNRNLIPGQQAFLLQT
jgi:hypothetical protein